MRNLPTTPSWRPSGPIAREVGVYSAPRTLSYRAIGAIAGFLAMLAFAICLYLWLTGGQ